MTGRLRVGLIGCGIHGRTRLSPALKATGKVELVACADPEGASTSKAMQEYGYSQSHSDYREMLQQSDIDAVVIATPHFLLNEACLAAVQAKKHVFVEKPLGVNKAQAVAVREAAKKAKVSVMVGYCIRYNPSRSLVKSLIDSGAIGRVVQVSAAKGAAALKGWQSSLETGGGELLWHGVHVTDQVLWVVNSPAVKVYGEISWNKTTKADQDSTYVVTFKNGVTANFLVSQSLSGPFDYLEVLGTEGRIRAEWPSEQVVVHSKVVPAYRDPTTVSPVLPNYNLMYDIQMNAWVEAVLGGKQPPIGVDAAVNVLSIIDGVFESAKTQRPVMLTG